MCTRCGFVQIVKGNAAKPKYCQDRAYWKTTDLLTGEIEGIFSQFQMIVP